MFRKLIIFVFASILLQYNFAIAQAIIDNFEKLAIAENFETSSGNWSLASGSDNLFLIQDGQYLLNRKSTVSPYAIISGIALNQDAYKLVASLNLQKVSDDKGSIGLLFALQDDRRGGYLVEFNKSAQYRIRQLAGSDYNYLTGSEKNGGWLKSDAVNDLGTANIIEVRTTDHNYDLYINSKFIKTINNKVYSRGSFGLVIGPGSKGSVDFIKIFTHNVEVSQKAKGDEEDIAALAQSIIKLKTELNKLKEENETLRKTINAVKSETQPYDGEKNSLKEQLAIKQNEYNELLEINDSLLKANNELNKYKNLIGENDNGDLVINLSKSLKSEKEKNTALQLENNKLQDQLNELNKVDKKSETKNKENFVIPK